MDQRQQQQQQTVLQRPRSTSLSSSTLYPISVTLVVEKLDRDPALETAITNLRSLCRDLHITFSMREYNSYRYRHDRDEIERLPALHLYKHNYHTKTFYLNTRPVQIIEDAVYEYVTELNLKQARKQRWSSIPGRIRTFLTRLLHRPTRMERFQQEQQEQRSRAPSRRGSILDW